MSTKEHYDREGEKEAAALSTVSAKQNESRAKELDHLRLELAEARRLLNSGTIRLVVRDGSGQVGFMLWTEIDLRTCIAEAIDAAMVEPKEVPK